jgi:methylenetetrahydrofolate reductase (NADPH)
MAQARDLGLLETTFFLIGVGPARSAAAAERMVKTIPGVYIPDSLIDRLRKTPKDAQREEGIKICVEIIQQVREIEGVSGVHVMAFRQEEMIAEIIHRAGLFPRRGPRPRPIRPHFQIERRYEEQ